MGVALKVEPTGKLFPVSDSARSVLHALLERCRELGVELLTDHRVQQVSVEPREDGRRFRIEHAQLIQANDIERIAALGMIVSAQPHAAAYPDKDLALIGADRLSRAYPYRALLDAGVPLAFGSDYPGESTFDPLFGIHLAVNMRSPQAISPEEAIAAYTLGSACAEFRETEKGKLATGYLGDMVVLSADPTTIDPESIKDILVEMTFVDGRRVYTRTPD